MEHGLWQQEGGPLEIKLDQVVSQIPSSIDRQPTQSIRVPCRARGVPGVHNRQNAFIEIPANPTHGMVLRCSHPVCAGSGRQFRWCAVCKTHVAKRNFRKRHSHGLLPPRNSSSTQGENTCHLEWSDPTIAGYPAPSQPHAVSFGSSEAASMTSSASTRMQGERRPFEWIDATTTAEHAQPHPSVRPHSVSFSSSEAASITSSTSETKMSMKLTPQELRWVSLLHNRPNTSNPESTEKWLESVLNVSEPSTIIQPPNAELASQAPKKVDSKKCLDNRLTNLLSDDSPDDCDVESSEVSAVFSA